MSNNLFGSDAPSVVVPTLPLAAGRPDDFQTPPIALQPLIPFLRPSWRIWEPSCGKGRIVNELRARGFSIEGTDILTGTDFFRGEPKEGFDCIVTNPPYSCKDQYIERCYDLGRPFALLMPLTALEGKKRQGLYRRHGLELILMDRRINFETPSGEGKGSWFATAWYTWRLGLGSGLSFIPLAKESGGLI